MRKYTKCEGQMQLNRDRPIPEDRYNFMVILRIWRTSSPRKSNALLLDGGSETIYVLSHLYNCIGLIPTWFWTTEVKFLAGVRDSSLLYNVVTGCGAHLASYTTGNGSYFSMG
jgi:hypothetical protein